PVFHVHGIDLGIDVEVVLVDLVVIEVHAGAPVAAEVDAGTEARVAVHPVLAVRSARSVGQFGAKIDVPEEESGACRDVPLVGGIEMPVEAQRPALAGCAQAVARAIAYVDAAQIRITAFEANETRTPAGIDLITGVRILAEVITFVGSGIMRAAGAAVDEPAGQILRLRAGAHARSRRQQRKRCQFRIHVVFPCSRFRWKYPGFAPEPIASRNGRAHVTGAASIGQTGMRGDKKPATCAGFLSDQLVPRKGLEPSRVAPLAPEASASTNSATWAGVRPRRRGASEPRKIAALRSGCQCNRRESVAHSPGTASRATVKCISGGFEMNKRLAGLITVGVLASMLAIPGLDALKTG